MSQELTTTKKSPRNSSFELLRIISMVLIITHHYANHGGFNFDTAFTMNKAVYDLLYMGGKLGVNCFVLISGYFLCTQVKLRVKGIIKYIFQVTFFSAAIYFALCIFGISDFSIKQAFKEVLPLIFGKWWFATAYFVMILVAPFIAKAINLLDRKDHRNLIIITTVLWSVIPTVLNTTMLCNDFVWFIYLFTVAAYIRKYPVKLLQSKLIMAIVFALSMLSIASFAIGCDALSGFIPALKGKADYFFHMQRLPILAASVSLFCLFKNLKPFSSKAINTVAAAMFGVYLLHDERVFRRFMWDSIFKNSIHQSSSLLILHAILTIAIIFIVCTAISFVYNITLDRLIGFAIDKLSDPISRALSAVKRKLRAAMNLINKKL